MAARPPAGRSGKSAPPISRSSLRSGEKSRRESEEASSSASTSSTRSTRGSQGRAKEPRPPWQSPGAACTDFGTAQRRSSLQSGKLQRPVLRKESQAVPRPVSSGGGSRSTSTGRGGVPRMARQAPEDGEPESPTLQGPGDRTDALKRTFDMYDEGGTGAVPALSAGVILWTSGYAVPMASELQALLWDVDPEQQAGAPVSWGVLLGVAQRLEDMGRVLGNGGDGSLSTTMKTSRKTMQRGRSYLDHGQLVDDQQVLELMKALDEHRRKCERDNKYLEARSTAKRLHDLKVYEEAKRKSNMGKRQQQERSDAEQAFSEECTENNRLWDEKMAGYQTALMEQVVHLKEAHAEQLAAFRAEMQRRAPAKPQWSRELLNQRKIMESLGRQGKYLEAEQVKRLADKMEKQEMQTTSAMFEAEVELKEGSLRAKQQLEMEALMQRATRGRDELRKARALDAERRQQRFKNVMRELEALHRLEHSRLDNFLEKKTIAGKRDDKVAQQLASTFKKREPSSGQGTPTGTGKLNIGDMNAEAPVVEAQ